MIVNRSLLTVCRFLALSACVVAAGCMPHFKDGDSYANEFRDTWTHPDGVTAMPEKGDPYTFSGIAEGTGGQIARQSYASDGGSPDPRDATETGRLGVIDREHKETPDVKSGSAGNFEDLPKGMPNTSNGVYPGLRRSDVEPAKSRG